MRTKITNAYPPILLFLFLTSACGRIQPGVVPPTSESALEATIESQNTQLAELSTEVAELKQTNQSQWDAISYLSTQMPVALELTTPISEGIFITPTPWLDIEYPPSARTGIAEIDSVIDAFLTQPIDSRLALVRYIQSPCTTADGLGGPPKCADDEPEGTLVETFPVLYSEGVHVRPENIQSVFGFSIRGLFAVYRVPESAYATDYWPIGEYGIVFTSEDGGYPHTIIIHVTNGQIVRLEFNMGWPPFDQVWERSDTFILPPIR